MGRRLAAQSDGDALVRTGPEGRGAASAHAADARSCSAPTARSRTAARTTRNALNSGRDVFKRWEERRTPPSLRLIEGYAEREINVIDRCTAKQDGADL